MKNLLAEMARYGIQIKDLQELLNCTEKTVRNKISGVTEFSYLEAEKIRDSLFPSMKLEYLFYEEKQKQSA